jgi:hypothetical protein
VIVFDYDYSAAMTRNIGSPTREVFSIAESDMTARYGAIPTSPGGMMRGCFRDLSLEEIWTGSFSRYRE